MVTGIMFEVMVEKHFSAAHHLLNYHGQCENPHGHNFVVRVWVQGPQLDAANVLVDYKELKAQLNVILDQLDHTDLNENPCIAGESPSSEFLAQYIYRRLKPHMPGLSRTCVFETPTACAFYFE
jgi:6-pyruvoyltetrahydropterin/6-carboxytetrahydropterin synthase